MSKQLPIILLIAIVFAGAGFFGGTKYQQGKRSSVIRQVGNGQLINGQGARGNVQFQGNRNGFRPVNGEIIAADEKSITVKMPDGSSKIVILSEKTEINKASSGGKEDLKTGEKVMVIGTENSDGSVTAQNIQLNPVMRGLNQPDKNQTQ